MEFWRYPFDGFFIAFGPRYALLVFTDDFDDLVVNELLKEVALKKGMQPAIPMVLIEHPSSVQLRRVYAG